MPGSECCRAVRAHVAGVPRPSSTSIGCTAVLAVTSSYLCKPNSESWKFDWKVEVCFHRNASIDLCQCEAAEWQGLQDGIWTAVNCSYANKYVDVKLSNKKPAWFTLSIQEAVQVMKAAAGRGNSCVE